MGEGALLRMRRSLNIKLHYTKYKYCSYNLATLFKMFKTTAAFLVLLAVCYAQPPPPLTPPDIPETFVAANVFLHVASLAIAIYIIVTSIASVFIGDNLDLLIIACMAVYFYLYRSQCTGVIIGVNIWALVSKLEVASVQSVHAW